MTDKCLIDTNCENRQVKESMRAVDHIILHQENDRYSGKFSNSWVEREGNDQIQIIH